MVSRGCIITSFDLLVTWGFSVDQSLEKSAAYRHFFLLVKEWLPNVVVGGKCFAKHLFKGGLVY